MGLDEISDLPPAIIFKIISNHTTRTVAQSPIEEKYNMNMY